jgi:hypothetical protein
LGRAPAHFSGRKGYTGPTTGCKADCGEKEKDTPLDSVASCRL